MSCFLSAATPSRFNCCTGVYLLFLGSGMRTSCAPACSATNKTGNANNVSNRQRMWSPGASLTDEGSAIHTKNRRAEALLVFWMANLLLRLGDLNSISCLPAELLMCAALGWAQNNPASPKPGSGVPQTPLPSTNSSPQQTPQPPATETPG